MIPCRDIRGSVRTEIVRWNNRSIPSTGGACEPKEGVSLSPSAPMWKPKHQANARLRLALFPLGRATPGALWEFALANGLSFFLSNVEGHRFAHHERRSPIPKAIELR
jgi:hypothetical protein